MKFLRRIDIVVLSVIAVMAAAVVVIDFFDLFEISKRLNNKEINYSLLCLLFLSFIATHLIIRFIAAEDQNEASARKLDELVTSSDSLRIRLFEDSFEVETYLAKRIHEAKAEICDLTWKLVISPGFAVGRRKESHELYEKALAEFTGKLIYREIWIFNDHRRVAKLQKRLQENKDGYSCRYYRDNINKIPRLQVVIIDEEEVIFFASASNSLLCSIKGAAVCGIFKPYFEESWKNAIPIKEGKTIFQNEVNYILKTYGKQTTPAT